MDTQHTRIGYEGYAQTGRLSTSIPGNAVGGLVTRWMRPGVGGGDPSAAQGVPLFISLYLASRSGKLRRALLSSTAVGKVEYDRIRTYQDTRTYPDNCVSLLYSIKVVSIWYLHRIGEMMIQRMCQDVSCRLYP